MLTPTGDESRRVKACFKAIVEALDLPDGLDGPASVVGDVRTDMDSCVGDALEPGERLLATAEVSSSETRLGSAVLRDNGLPGSSPSDGDATEAESVGAIEAGLLMESPLERAWTSSFSLSLCLVLKSSRGMSAMVIPMLLASMTIALAVADIGSGG